MLLLLVSSLHLHLRGLNEREWRWTSFRANWEWEIGAHSSFNAWGKGETKECKGTQKLEQESCNTTTWTLSVVTDVENEACKRKTSSKGDCLNGETYTGYKNPGHYRSHRLKEVIVNALCNIEVIPVFIRQALWIAAWSHIRVATSWNFLCFTLSVETFMLGLEIFFHELFTEYLVSYNARSNKSCQYKLEHNQNYSKPHISVKIELILVSEEHQEEGYGRIGVERCLLTAWISISHVDLRRKGHVHRHFIFKLLLRK